MAGAAGAIGKIRAETLALEGQKQEATKGRESLRGAISAMKTQQRELRSNLGHLHEGLDRINGAIREVKEHPLGSEHPQVAEQLAKLRAQREQIIGQISYLKNGIKEIGNRVKDYSEKLMSLNQNIEMMGSAINARKGALQQIAGQAAAQISLNSNRESGKKKG